jgi:LacI family transcriptional regulator
VVWADESGEGGDDAAGRLLARFPDLDGLLAYNDLMAIGAMRALQRAGREVPADVAVIGVDDIQLSSLVQPALTTIAIDRVAMGERAVELVLALRADPGGAPLRSTVPVSLVVRDSA